MTTESGKALESTLADLGYLLMDPSRLTILNDFELGAGGFGDVCLATLDGSSKVAVKQLRIGWAQGMRVRVAMRLARELQVWAKAKHPNILELLGYYLNKDYSIAQLVSPYMANGNVTQYMKRIQATIGARLKFVQGITSGMAYLHNSDPPICHGDLKPENVLVSDEPDAVLCDFGLAAFVRDPEDLEASSGLTTSRAIKGSTPYMSPELFQDTEAKHTLESDVWAWACTIFEIITDSTPYSTTLGVGNIILAIVQGTSPGSADLLSSLVRTADIPLRSVLETLQDLIPHCWEFKPNRRPSLSSILQRLVVPPEIERPQDPETPVQLQEDELVGIELSDKTTQTDALAPADPYENDNQSLEQPGIRFSGIAEELGGELTMSDRPLLAGRYVDIYQGTWTSPEGKKMDVAVKMLRASPQASISRDTTALKKRIDLRMKRETLVWTRAKHKNIHPLLGFRSHPEPQFISPWCRRGNLIDYLHNNPHLSKLDKLRLILQVGHGIAYLHSQTPPILHADIKPENVLINDSGEAALSNFGLSSILQSLAASIGLMTSEGARGTSPYMAQEFFVEETPRATCESAVYAFGGLILKVMSGKAPYEGIPPGKVLLRVVQGKQPESQAHPDLPASDPLWTLMRKCWESNPRNRPSISEVVAELEKEVARRSA